MRIRSRSGDRKPSFFLTSTLHRSANPEEIHPRALRAPISTRAGRQWRARPPARPLLALAVISGVLNVNRFRIYAGLSVITEWKYDAPDSVNNSGLNYANCELPHSLPFPLTFHPFTRSAVPSHLRSAYACTRHSRGTRSAPLDSATLSSPPPPPPPRRVTNN